jgi:stage II sporulation protein D
MGDKVRAILLLCLLTSPIFANEESRISILSILRPSEIQITIKSTGISVLKMISKGNEISTPLRVNSVLNVQAAQDQLLIEGYPGTVEHAELHCKDACRVLLEVRGKLERLYSGNMEFRSRNNTISIVLSIDKETLVGSILSSEAGEYQEPEVLRALAVVTRSFLAAGIQHPQDNADVCDTTHCQVFQGIEPNKQINDAVKSTRGLILTYHQKPFHPFYSRSCGGRTFTYEQVWGEKAPDYPFFPVSCPVCLNTTEVRWRSDLTLDTLRIATGIPVNGIRRVGGWIEVSNQGETRKFTAENFRIMLGRDLGWKVLPGNSFQIQSHSKSIAFEGAGFGHGVGLCQTGAAGLARLGKTYQQILSYYFPNTEIR